MADPTSSTAATIANYSPNTRWGQQHVEVTFKMWTYSATRTVTVGGNCLGFTVLEAAVSQIYDDLRSKGGDMATIILTDPAGKEMEAQDDEDKEDEWLKAMVVSLRIVAYDPPTLNEVREMIGVDPVYNKCIKVSGVFSSEKK
jgi:hypothetical protein